MVDLSVKIGECTLQNRFSRRSGAFSWEYNDGHRSTVALSLVAKTAGPASRGLALRRRAWPKPRPNHPNRIRALPAKASNTSSITSVPEYPSSSRRWWWSVNSETIE